MRKPVLWVAFGLVLLAASALAQTITEFPLPSPGGKHPEGIAPGPDGNLWFTETDGNRIGKITPSGDITEYQILPGSGLHGIVAGPDGNLWFTEEHANKIGRITTAGEITEFDLPQANSGPHTIAAGSDGNLWFTMETGNKIGRITPDGDIKVFSIPTPGSAPNGITAGPDGALWFVEEQANKIGRITTAGAFTEFSISPGSVPERIATGSDGALWFTEEGRNRIGRMTTGGKYTFFNVPTPNSSPHGITAGPDGALWFTEAEGNKVGRITTAGVITEFSSPTPNSSPEGITMGWDRNIWYAEGGKDKIGRVNIANACGNPESALCLNGGRFRVQVTWETATGSSGAGHAIGLTDDSGYFWFFSPDNIELVVKTLDACGVNQRFWVFGGGLTNVRVTMTVTDTLTGAVRVYENPQSTAFEPVQDTSAFAGCGLGAQPGDPAEAGADWLGQASAPEARDPEPHAYRRTEMLPLGAIAACTPSSTAMCLNDGRFTVEATWETATGANGPGRAIQLTEDSGYFWFFTPSNVELITKVLDACGVNAHHWVFAGGLTNVRVELTVTDTQTGAVQTYVNPLNTAFEPIQDTDAFATCP